MGCSPVCLSVSCLLPWRWYSFFDWRRQSGRTYYTLSGIYYHGAGSLCLKCPRADLHYLTDRGSVSAPDPSVPVRISCLCNECRKFSVFCRCGTASWHLHGKHEIFRYLQHLHECACRRNPETERRAFGKSQSTLQFP